MEKGYNLNEVANILGVKVRTIRYWIKTKKIDAHKIYGTNRWVIMESEVERMVNGEQLENDKLIEGESDDYED